MVLATYNVNSIRARLGRLVPWLAAVKPDVVCLQETKVVDDAFPREELAAAGYHAHFHGEKSYNGVAILSRVPLETPASGFDGAGADEGTRLITARRGSLIIVNTYIPQGTDPASDRFIYKLQWFARLAAYFERHFSPHDEIIWAGDFNVAPEPIDVHDPQRLLGSVGFHPDEHRALASVKAWGFNDVFRRHCPDGGQYTFWDYRVRGAMARGLGWRVDHIFATAPVADRSRRSWIDRAMREGEKPSDHAPLLAEFDD